MQSAHEVSCHWPEAIDRAGPDHRRTPVRSKATIHADSAHADTRWLPEWAHHLQPTSRVPRRTRPVSPLTGRFLLDITAETAQIAEPAQPRATPTVAGQHEVDLEVECAEPAEQSVDEA